MASWAGLQQWLDRWAPLAEWAVAAGTFALAIATVWLAKRAHDEAKQVGEQVALQREQIEASALPNVYPVARHDWAWKMDNSRYEGSNRTYLLPVKNGGPGLALNVTGQVCAREYEGMGAYQRSIIAGSIASGDEYDTRLSEGGVEQWIAGSFGYLRYDDVTGVSWETRFICRGRGTSVYFDVDPPRRTDELDEWRCPPPEWGQVPPPF